MTLTSIEVLTPPIPSEPEVGSFALCESGHIAQHFLNEIIDGWQFNTSTSWWSGWWTWETIYPQIRILYSPSGEVVWKKGESE